MRAAASPEAISDDEVVDDMVASVLPGGALREYLECACAAAVFGNTLFVHVRAYSEPLEFY